MPKKWWAQIPDRNIRSKKVIIENKVRMWIEILDTQKMRPLQTAVNGVICDTNRFEFTLIMNPHTKKHTKLSYTIKMSQITHTFVNVQML